MFTRYRNLFVGALLLALNPFVMSTAQAYDEPYDAVREAIQGRLAAYQQAIEEGDDTALAAIFTDESLFLGPWTDEVMTRDEYLRRLKSEGIGRVSLSTFELSVSSDFAYEAGSYESFAEDGGLINDGHYLTVWEKDEGGDWWISRLIWNRIAR